MALAAGRALDAEQPGLHLSSFRGPAGVSAGDRAAVAGRVAPAQATPVLVERLTASGIWAPFAMLQAGPDGRLSAELPIRESVTLRASVRTPAGDVFPGPQRVIGRWT